MGLLAWTDPVFGYSAWTWVGTLVFWGLAGAWISFSRTGSYDKFEEPEPPRPWYVNLAITLALAMLMTVVSLFARWLGFGPEGVHPAHPADPSAY